MGNSNLRLFWLLNIAYWATYYVVNFFTSPIFLSFDITSRTILIISFLCWIMMITGVYRFIYQKLKIWEKPLKVVIQQTVLAIILMSTIDICVRHYINPYLLDDFFEMTSISYETDTEFLRAAFNQDPSLMNKYLSLNGQCFKIIAYCFWCVAFNFYRYSFTVKDTLVSKLKVENQLKEAELINLRSQLNPHFLFNSLNSIHSLALAQNEKASDSVLLLSDLMRYTLNYEKKDVVSLEEEIEIVNKYLELEKIRFGKRLTYSFDIQPDTFDKKIPPIIVQTLAENAIKHSISQNTEGGYLNISSRLDDKFLIVEIKNSGQLKPKNTNLISTDGGIGIENTCKRLKMIYGENARFELKNNSSNEVIATLKIPI